ncbi:TDA11 Topoisomerase I damage affected protein 11 [Candida maltosa Xu316]
MTTIADKSTEFNRGNSLKKQNSLSTPNKNLYQPLEFKVRRSSSLSSSSSSPSTINQQAKPNGIRNSSSISKGLNIFAVSPLTKSPSVTTVTKNPSHQRKPSYTSPSLPQVSENESKNYSQQGLRYDLPLPPMQKLIAMDIDEQLRYLALKEMSIVEIKDNITNLNNKLKENQDELHKLREIIQRSLYKELSTGNATVSGGRSTTNRPRQNSNPRDEAIARTKRRSSSIFHDSQTTAITPASSTSTTINPESTSKLWSGLSKPLNLIHQFDTMLQNEFEKSLQSNQETQRILEKRLSHQSKSSEGSISSIGSINSPLQSKAQISRPVSKQYYNKPDDMIQTVSSSIWSFVNEVKTNMLSSLQENESENEKNLKPPPASSALYNLDNGSTVSMSALLKGNKPDIDLDLDTDFLEPLASDEDEDTNFDTIDLSIYKR